jgi:succinoglycan biosynthesis protein ExoU
MNNRTVSILIAAYNSSPTIVRAVRSALEQPEAAEVVVIDDASTDDTAAQARGANDNSGRLKVISLPTNSGPSFARNRALQETDAPWFCVLDADDFFLPGRLHGLLQHVEQADMVADDLWRVAEADIDGHRQLFLGSITAPRTISFSEFVLSNITNRKRQRGELGFIKPLMRRSFFYNAGLRYQNNLRLGEDYELYARALAAGATLRLVPPQGYVSVVRPNSLSGCHSETDLLNLRDCDEVLATLPNLSPQDQQALRQHYLSTDCRLQWRLLILAVKRRDIGKACATFCRPLPVPVYLARALFEQFVFRARRALHKHLIT